MKRIATFTLAILGVTGLKLYNKSSDHDDIKKSYIESCTSAKCVLLVNERFESCFEANYSLGGRHSAGHLNQDDFENCLSH